MLVQVPKHAKCLQLPKPQGINGAWDYLKSIAGKSWLVKQLPEVYKPSLVRKNGHAMGKPLFPDGYCLGYIKFSNGLFTLHYCRNVYKEFHFGMGGRNAGNYRTPDILDSCVEIRRHNVRYANDVPRLVTVNYKIYVEI